MRPLLALALFASTLSAHVMSMSSGDVKIDGARAHYELHMPTYEVAHIKSPEAELFDSIRFFTSGQQGRLTSKSCHDEPAQGNYVCVADYEFPISVGRLDVECTFHKITVPNHVHLLRAEKEGKTDQAIFDFTSSKAQIRFDPPSAAEIAITQTAAGVMRAVGGLSQILFLATLALAARSRRELAALAGMFLLGQIASALIAQRTAWEPAPRFVEAATALTIAYMAVEILALPNAGKRWLIAGVLGVFHGLYFALFLRATGDNPAYVLTGAAVSELILIAIFAWTFSRISRLAAAFRPAQVSAGLLFGVSMFWFFLRMKG